MTQDKKRFAKLLKKLGKRPRTVLEKILENGSVSTYELGELGYDQPPRAAQDLKEAGVSLITKFGKHPETGSRMGIYSLAPEQPFLNGKFTGRKAFPKKFREKLLAFFKSRCNLCNVEYQPTVLQIDHRIPYILAGESEGFEIEDFQLLCGSHQRLKSWECEHCGNREKRLVQACRTCYWAFPETCYEHVATLLERRADVTWKGEAELETYERLRVLAEERSLDVPTAMKIIIKHYLD